MYEYVYNASAFVCVVSDIISIVWNIINIMLYVKMHTFKSSGIADSYI